MLLFLGGVLRFPEAGFPFDFSRKRRIMAQVITQVVKLKDGSTAVINAADFDPKLHTDLTLGKKSASPTKKKVSRRAK